MDTLGKQKESHLAEDNKRDSVVLAVDDQPICLTVLTCLLESQGLGVETAHDGLEALSMWKEKQYPLIVSDCSMPNMDGYSLAGAVRQIEEKNNMNRSTILAVTSHEKQEDIQLCLDAGMDYVMSKPLDRTKVEVAISAWRSAHLLNQSSDKPLHGSLLSTSTPVEASVLSEIFPDKSKHTAILEQLQKHIQEDYQTLQHEVGLENLLEVERLAHRMKGACKMVGANDIAMVCEEIEITAKKGHVDPNHSIPALEKRIHEFDAFMAQQATVNSELRAH